jgi:ABC-type dipeptide/oligopeptide/nickel transport system permease subunit
MSDLAGGAPVGPTAGSIGSPAEAIATDISAARPLRAEVWRRFRRNKLAVAGVVFIILLILVAIFASVIAPYSITERTSEFRQGPSADHWFGTDRIGRDVFSRVVYGARVSL